MDIATRSKDIQAAEGEKSIGHRMDNMVLDPTLDISLSDRPQWNLKELLGVKRYLQTLQITNASTGVLYTFGNTPSNILGLFPTPDIASYFAFMRYEVVFELEVQSTFQHQGALILNVIPLGLTEQGMHPQIGIGGTQLLGAGDIITNRTLLPHDFITFGHNGNYKVVLPWTCNRNMLPTSSLSLDATTAYNLHNYQLNVFQIVVYDQLQHVAGAVGTTSIRMWAHLQNLEYSGFKPNY